MRVLAGTSGYSYKEWKGPFYPDDLSAARMLRFYAGHFGTVEINNTFYKMPTDDLLAGWASQVPDDFTFALKAPQRLTHQKRLKEAEETLREFIHLAGKLGDKLGPLLFQLPPNFKKDVPRLDAFLALLPSDLRVAFEFRNESWFDEETYETLRTYRVALCVAESDDLATPVVATTDWGYLRLRRTDYTTAKINAWAKKILAEPWSEAFVYLKHDDGDAPSLATKLRKRVGRAVA